MKIKISHLRTSDNFADGKEGKEYYRPNIVYSGRMKARDISKNIEESTDQPAIRTMRLLHSVGLMMGNAIADGYIIELPGFGTLKATLKMGEDGKPQVKGIIVVPDKSLKARLENTKFEEVQ